MANALQLIGSLPAQHAHVQMLGSFAGNVSADDAVWVRDDDLFALAIRCLCRAIKIATDDPLLWYELALGYYERARTYPNTTDAGKYLKVAMDTIKHAITLLPTRWLNWNLLGIICATNQIQMLPLAQHCFIRALELNKKSAVPWTNLGALYLSQGAIKLANKAFSRAQQCETDYVYGWTGQACIAEHIGDKEEALDLFKHCTTLQYTAESALGFGHAVCHILADNKYATDPKFRFAIERMYAASAALDSVEWYCRSELDQEANVAALNFQGYLCAHQRLWSLAIRSFRMAADAASAGPIRDKMLCNLGFCYLNNMEPLKALEAFHSVAEATFSYTVGLAYSHFKGAFLWFLY